MNSEGVERVLTDIHISSNFNLHDDNAVIYFPGYKDVFIQETGLVPIDHVTIFEDSLAGYNNKNLVYVCMMNRIKVLKANEIEEMDSKSLFIRVNKDFPKKSKKKHDKRWKF